MIRHLLLLLFFGISCQLWAQLVTTDPEIIDPDQPLTLYFDLTKGNGGLSNFNSDIYVHMGLILEGGAITDWQHDPTWLDNSSKYRLTDLGNDQYSLVLAPTMREWFGGEPGEVYTDIAIVLRDEFGNNEHKNVKNEDIYIPVGIEPMPTLCENAVPFCTDYDYRFPLNTFGDESEDDVPYWGCLTTRPAPAWYYLKIEDPGDIEIHMAAAEDIDFAVWGPFEDPASGCTAGLTQDNMDEEDFSYGSNGCSYSGQPEEDVRIRGAQTGEYYMFLITNYAVARSFIDISQTGGNGSTDCSIVENCDMFNFATNVGEEDANNEFSVTGEVYFNNQPTGGTLVFTDQTSGLNYTVNAPFSSPTTYSIDNIPADGLEHIITVDFEGDGKSCPASDTIVSPTTEVATVDLSGDGSVCLGDSVALTLTATGVGPWNVILAVDGVNQPAFEMTSSPLVTYITPAGDEVYTLASAEDGNGAAAVVSGGGSSTVIAAGNVQIDPAGPFCQGTDTVILTANTTTGTWSGTDVVDGQTGAFLPTTPGIHNILYVETGSCAGRDSVDIEVLPEVNVTIDPVPSLCDNDAPFDLEVDTVGGNWSGLGITDGNAGTFDPAIAGAGTHDISYILPSGCSYQEVIVVEVASVDILGLAPAGPFCDEDAALLLEAGASIPVIWSGAGIIDSDAGLFDPAAAGAGIHQVNLASTGICPTTDSIEIQVIQTSGAKITTVGDQCLDADPVILEAVGAVGVWSGTGVFAGQFEPANAGVGTHTVYHSASGVCGLTDSININVIQTGDPTVTEVDVLCLGAGTITLTSATLGIGAWSGDGIVDPVAGTFNPDSAGEGIHTVRYAIAGQCPSSDDISIEVLSAPEINLSVDTPAACAPYEFEFSLDQTALVSTYSWSFSNGDKNSDDIQPRVTLDQAGSYHAQFDFETIDGCQGSVVDSNIVVVYPTPVADFNLPEDSVYDTDGEVQLENTSVGTGTYIWSTDGAAFSFAQDPVMAVEEPGTFQVRLDLSNDDGCASFHVDTLVVHERTAIYVPNAFTPDGTGFNEVFLPVFKGLAGEPTLYIYDRWGDMIYEGQAAWDGNYKGQPARQDVYTWTLEYLNPQLKSSTLTGRVTLIR